MKQWLVIPGSKEIPQWEQLAEEYHLGYEYNEFFHPELLENPEKAIACIKDYKERRLPEITGLHGAFYDVLPTSADCQVRQTGRLRISQSIDYAKKIGAKWVVFHTNYNPFLNNKEYVKQWIADNIQYWESVLKQHPDIHIYLENMFDTSPDIMEELARNLCKYENFGICFDYAHAVLSKTDVRVWVEKLGKYIKHIHINDNDLISDLHQAWGAGSINRQNFYDLYGNYIKEATILIETSSLQDAKASIETFIKDGFWLVR